jgi:hypothetical protein
MLKSHLPLLLVAPALLGAQPPAFPAGTWVTDGYGIVLEITDGARVFEVTSVSCIQAGSRRRAAAPAGAIAAFGAANREPDLIVYSEGPDRVRLRSPGSTSDILARRVDRKPSACDQRPASTPPSTFEAFAATMTEHYPFFVERHMDWPAAVASTRSRITSTTSPSDLFSILAGMLAPLNDGHTGLDARAIDQAFYGQRRSTSTLEGKQALAALSLSTRYVSGPLREFCEGQLEHGMMPGGIAYVRIRAFMGYTKDEQFGSGLVALEAALDTVLATATAWKGLIIDVRINEGGWDAYGLAIARRLTRTEYVAYEKQARNDPVDPTRWTPAQVSMVRPTDRPSYFGPVVELIGIQTPSAAETFTQALLNRPVRVTRIGEPTQGVFSDVMERRLPNGWVLRLPNERFVTEGRSYDVVGIAPDIAVESFSPKGLASGRDAAVEAALQLLR